MSNIESPVITYQETLAASYLLDGVVRERLRLSSIPFFNGFASRRADKLLHRFGGAVKDMEERQTTETVLEPLIDDRKDVQFLVKALAKGMSERESFAEGHDGAADSPLWQARDLACAGLERALRLQPA